MSDTSLIDRLVTEEYREFEDDPLGYVFDRQEAVERLVDDGVKPDDAKRAWDEFERKYLTVNMGGATFSAHGIDRARNLGETVYIDEGVHSKILQILHEKNQSVEFKELTNEAGIDNKTAEHNLWILRRRGLIETRTDGYGNRRTVALCSEDKKE